MDKDLITKKLEYMIDALDVMGQALKAYGSDPKNKLFFYAAQKKAEEVVDCAISINQEILFSEYKKMSKSYYDSFIDLEIIGIFSKPELEKLSATAGFRNRLVHEYMGLDEGITVQSMAQALKLFPAYIKKINEWLKQLS